MSKLINKTFNANTKDINYLNRDFASLRQQLIDFTKQYYPQSYKDFSESSPGQIFIEQAAYVGDVLSFYLDNQVQETYVFGSDITIGNNPSATYKILSVKLTLTVRFLKLVLQLFLAVLRPDKPAAQLTVLLLDL